MIKVRFQGSETNIAVTSPNMLCGEILVQAKLAFGLNPNRSFELKHKRNLTVDNSLPFRMSGVLANSTLDLVPKLASSLVSITLDFASKRVTLANPVLASYTLQRALQEYPGIESIRYVNRVIHSADFSSVTLESLGLTNGTALFKAEGSARHEPVVVTSVETVQPVLPTTSSPPPLQQQQPNFLPPALGEADLQVAKATLVKIITNLVHNPNDRGRLGKIRLAKFQEKTNYHPSALEFAVKTLGFNVMNGGEDLVLGGNVSIENWKQHIEALQRPGPIIVTPFVAFTPPPPPVNDSFDPFKTILSTSAPRPRLEDSNLKSYEDQVAELKQKRERMLAAHTHALDDRAVCAFSSMADIPKPPTQDHETAAADDDEETKVLARHFKDVAEKQKKASQFQTKAMKEHAELVKSKVYVKTLIRIVLPNKSILQGTFHTGEVACAAILSVIAEHCTLQEQQQVLVIGSGRPLVQLDPTKSFFELGLFPAAFVHVMGEGSEIAIRKEVFALPTHADVPQGEALVASSKPAVAAASKPKWLKLNKT